MFLVIILYILVFVQSLLNIFLYINNPLKHTDVVNCYKLPCNIYTIYSTIILFTIDIILLGILTYTENILDFLPKTWFLFYGFIGYLVIFLIYSSSKIIKRNKRINPPDEILLNKDFRFSFYIISLLLYLAIIFLRYTKDPLETIETQPFLEQYFFNRFGGFKEKNRVNFILSYLSMIVIPISIFRTLDGAKYQPELYNLPLSWKL